MRSNGYPNPEELPLGYLFDEYMLVVGRKNADLVEQAVFNHLAMTAVLSKEGGVAFNDELKKKLG